MTHKAINLATRLTRTHVPATLLPTQLLFLARAPNSFQLSRGVKSWTKNINRSAIQADDDSNRYTPYAPSAASSSSRLRSDLPDYDDDFPIDAKRNKHRHSQQHLDEDDLAAWNEAMEEQDKIILKNMEYYGHHGVYAHETSTGQPFQVDLEMEADLSRAAQTDDLADTVNYEKIHAVVGEIMTGKPYKLLERVSFLIIESLLEKFDDLQSVSVTIRKPNVGLKGTLDYAAVSMKRYRQQVAQNEDEEVKEEEVPPVSRRHSSTSRSAPPASSSASSRSFSSNSTQQPKTEEEPAPNPLRPEDAPTPQRNLFAELDAKFEEYAERARASSTETDAFNPSNRRK